MIKNGRLSEQQLKAKIIYRKGVAKRPKSPVTLQMQGGQNFFDKSVQKSVHFQKKSVHFLKKSVQSVQFSKKIPFLKKTH